ncbi:hypothetical protein KKG41_04065 [Patescibacteria group bacterium]|nr:hypothetical protein [Patescibacteria group bacterium]MBU1889955.1 hypothetical protein [Patescibacteria group bacterium]
MPNTERVTLKGGYTIIVDTTDSACQRFGFSHNEQIQVSGTNDEGNVVGVAPMPHDDFCVWRGKVILWVRVGENVLFCPSPRVDLKKINRSA